MSESNHTPIPWQTPSASTGVYSRNDALIASCGTHTIIEALQGRGSPTAITERTMMANARHIVRCVNAHDDLLAACKKAESELKRLFSTYRLHSAWDELRPILTAAIAKADGAE